MLYLDLLGIELLLHAGVEDLVRRNADTFEELIVRV